MNNVAVSEEAYFPWFVYMGDTHISALEKKKEIFDYPVIIIECTFIKSDPEILRRADRDGHIIWDQLKKYVLAFPQITFVLIHWSLRYTEAEIYDFFNEQKLIFPNESLDNIVLFLGNVT